MRRRSLWAVGIGASVAVALLLWVRLGALPDGLLEPERPSAIIVDRAGAPLYEARAADGARGTSLTADTLPEALVQATLAAEDQRFFHHFGVDPVALARAAAHDLIAL